MNITRDFFKVILIKFTMKRERSFKNKIPSQYGVVIKNDKVVIQDHKGGQADKQASRMLSHHI
mgnify:CR=1 FL=1